MFKDIFHCLVVILQFSSTVSLIVPSLKSKDNQEICHEDRGKLRLCYTHQARLRSLLITFTTRELLDENAYAYRFVLRSIDPLTLAVNSLQIMTNFTEFIEKNNSLTIFNLDSGQYEICLEFQLNAHWFIYQPRDACISFRIGHLSDLSFRQDSTEIFLTLALSISSFFILGLLVQWRKTKSISQTSSTPSSVFDREPIEIPRRSRASSLLSTSSLKKQRDRIIRKLFRTRMDESDTSQIRQWARNRAFRHRISAPEKHLDSSTYLNTILEDQRSRNPSISTVNDIHIIPMHECSVNYGFETDKEKGSIEKF